MSGWRYLICRVAPETVYCDDCGNSAYAEFELLGLYFCASCADELAYVVREAADGTIELEAAPAS